MPTKLITATKARKELFHIIQNVQEPDTRYIVTINSKPEMVLISAKEYDALMKQLKEEKWNPNDFFGPSSLILRDESSAKYKVRKRNKAKNKAKK